MSQLYVLKRVQKIPVDIEEVWNFFSRPDNLIKITPAAMHIKNVSVHNVNSIYQGQILEYRLKPLWGITVYWMTEITHVSFKRYFVDELKAGPFSTWRHHHHFKQVDGGVEMTDVIKYKVPFFILGDIINALIVRRKLNKLFDYRYKKIEKLFSRI